MLFFKPLQTLVQLRTSLPQERLLQRQFQMCIGQRFLDPPQLFAELGHFIDFTRLFHPDNLSISATAQLPYPMENGGVALDLVFALHGCGSRLAGFNLPHDLHFESFAISNHSHWYPVFYYLKVPTYFRTGPLFLKTESGKQKAE